MMTPDPMLSTSPATPAELRDPPRRRISWGAVLAVALAAAGAGVVAGSRLPASGSSSAPPAPGIATPAPSHSAHARPPGVGSQAVYISPARQQLVGVRSAAVSRQRVEGTIRTVGTLAYDETRTARIHTRVAGWVEKLYVDHLGKSVRRGQPLFTVYSPELATAQAEHLAALRARRLTGTASPELATAGDALVAASRDRMRRWNITDEQIAELERTGQPSRAVTIASPFDGVVLDKEAFAGQYVTPEMTSFKLADLSTIWAIGQVFEYEAARLRTGDTVEIEFPYGQAARVRARIELIYPEVDAQTRRVRFRATLDNRDRKLKPDTYIQMIWHGDASDHLVVPKEAVIDTGARKYVLLAHAGGYFEPRDIEVGPPIGELYPVVAGAAEGDRVVTSAQFLIDSETNMAAAMQAMMMTMPGMDMGGMDHAGHDMPPADTGSAPEAGSSSHQHGTHAPDGSSHQHGTHAPDGSSHQHGTHAPGM